jgi:NitT/TauT family transport system permease protein
MTGVQGMDHRLVEVAQVLGATRLQVVRRIVIPAVVPAVLAGGRLGIGIGWACIVAAEMIGGESTGLGRMIVSYGELLQIDAVVVGMLAIGLLGYVLNELFLLGERRLLPWRKSARV